MSRSHVQSPLSPPTSVRSTPLSVASFDGRGPRILPQPRRRRLRPGSEKEVALINYLDDRILRITRRYAKKFSNERLDGDDEPGYTDYDQFVADVDPLLDVVWISGTPTIQIAYLLSIAGLASAYLRAFTFSRSLFYITAKIDHGFASLLDPTGAGQAPASVTGPVSVTEQVRIRSLIDGTRISAVNAATSAGHEATIQDLTLVDSDPNSRGSDEGMDGHDDDDCDAEDDDDDDPGSSISLSLSKIYRRTLNILGDSLVARPPSRGQTLRNDAK